MGLEVQCGIILVDGLPKQGRRHILQDLRGKRYGRLVVKDFAYQKETKASRTTFWVCKCDCGNEKIISSNSLRSGRTKSCGCLRKEICAQKGKKSATLCLCNRRLYAVWRAMKSRCLNGNRPEYKNYGGRGITVCEEWLKDFSTFCIWAHQAGYDENSGRGKCTLDRIDNNGNYEPSNCRWVDMKIQSNNKRNNSKKNTVSSI